MEMAQIERTAAVKAEAIAPHTQKSLVIKFPNLENTFLPANEDGDRK